jgi:hypothetical protein
MLVWSRVVNGGEDDCEGDDERWHGIEAGREVLVDWDVFVVFWRIFGFWLYMTDGFAIYRRPILSISCALPVATSFGPQS